MKRIQLDIPENKLEEIEKMMKEHGISTKKQLFNVALNLLQWALKEKDNNRIIASVDEKNDSYKEIILGI